jgi:hypothetical protein
MQTNRIVVAIYEGAFGPTLRIDVQMRDQASIVERAFKHLASGTQLEMEISDPGTFLFSGLSLMRLKADEDAPPAARMANDQAGRKSEVLWTMSRQGWENCVGLAAGLFEQEMPGHQYLTPEGEGHLLVELAYKEFRPSAL